MQNASHWPRNVQRTPCQQQQGALANLFGGGGNNSQNLNPQANADAQIRVNQALINQTGQANRIGQVSPYGSTGYSQDANGNWTQTTAYSPEVQHAIDAQIQQQGQREDLSGYAMGAVNPILDMSGVGPVTTGAALNAVNEGRPLQSSIAPSGAIQASLDTRGLPGIQNQINTQGLPGQQYDINSATMGDPSVQNAIQQSYAGQMQLLQPQLDQQKQQLQTQLMDQGIPQGGDAWNTAMANLNRQQAVQTQQALTSATQQGIGLQGQYFGQAATSQGAHNTAQNTAFTQQGLQQAAANAAQAQGFGQSTQAGNFANQAQAQNFGQNQNQAVLYNQAAGQQFGQTLSQAQLDNQAQQQQLATALTRQQFPVQMANALTSGQSLQTPGMPSYTPVGQGLTAPNMGQLGLNQYNATTGAANSKANGLLSAVTSNAGSSAIGSAASGAKSGLGNLFGALVGGGMGMV